MEFEWRDVPTYEGFYKVSNYGDVCSVDRIVAGRRLKGRVLKQGINGEGYSIVTFSQESVLKTFSVHRLVHWAFMGIPEGEGYIKHKDGNPQNNRLDNLTHYDLPPNGKLSNPTVAQIRGMARRGAKTRQLAERFQISRGHVNQIKRGTRRKVETE